MADGVRCGRLRWFRLQEAKNVDDCVSTCRNVEVAGVKYGGRETMKNEMKLCCL